MASTHALDTEMEGDNNGETLSAGRTTRSGKMFKPCTECQEKKRKCYHGTANIGVTMGKVADRKRKRIPHDRSKGLSQTRNAIDYRKRHAIAAHHRARVIELMDKDIIDRVDREGGITPEGRFYKAMLMMLERLHSRVALLTAARGPNGNVEIPADPILLAANLSDSEKIDRIRKLLGA